MCLICFADSRSTQIPHTAQGRRNNVRQPSPPISTPSQAEDPTFAINKAKHNSFDPFVVSSSDSESERPAPAQATSPKLAKPSGKLARRRQAPRALPTTPTPAPAQAIPVPRANNQPNRGRHGRAHSAMMNLSRSAPITSSPIAYCAFPICDDMTDADGLTPPRDADQGSSGATGTDVRQWPAHGATCVYLWVPICPAAQPYCFSLFPASKAACPIAERRRVQHVFRRGFVVLFRQR